MESNNRAITERITAVFEENLSNRQLQKNIILRYASEFSKDLSYDDLFPLDYAKEPFDVKVVIVYSDQPQMFVSSDGKIAITSAFLEQTLNFSKSLIKNNRHIFKKIYSHARNCNELFNNDDTAIAFFTIRYVDETINNVILLGLLHELSHIAMLHHDIINLSCRKLKFIEYAADFVSVSSFLDMKDQVLSDNIGKIGFLAAHISPEVYLPILDFTLSKNAPFASAMKIENDCIEKVDTRLKRLEFVFEPLLIEYKKDFDQLNYQYDKYCQSNSKKGLSKKLCIARHSQLPQL